MGISVAISGAIILTVFIVVLFSVPNYVESIFSVGDASKQSTQSMSKVLKTEISLDSLAAAPASTVINFTLNNDGDKKLYQYEKFDLFVTYDSSTGKTVEPLSYSGSCQGSIPAAGSWCIEEVVWDLKESGILNSGEAALIRSQVSKNPVTGVVGLMIVTPNGVETSTSIAI